MGIQVRELREKLEDIKRFLGFTKNAELAEAVKGNVDATRVSQWHGKDGIPEPDLRKLADLVRLSHENLRDWSAAELREWLDVSAPEAALFKRMLGRARDGLIRIVRVNQPPAGMPSDRGMRPKSQAAAGPSAIEYLPCGAETLIEVAIPWAALWSPTEANVLLLLTDNAGTQLLTPAPVRVRQGEPTLRLPQTAASDPYAFVEPLGPHCAVALVTRWRREDISKAIAAALAGGDQALSNLQLNLIGKTVNADPFDWVVGKKEFFVIRE